MAIMDSEWTLETAIVGYAPSHASVKQTEEAVLIYRRARVASLLAAFKAFPSLAQAAGIDGQEEVEDRYLTWRDRHFTEALRGSACPRSTILRAWLDANPWLQSMSWIPAPPDPEWIAKEAGLSDADEGRDLLHDFLLRSQSVEKKKYLVPAYWDAKSGRIKFATWSLLKDAHRNAEKGRRTYYSDSLDERAVDGAPIESDPEAPKELLRRLTLWCRAKGPAYEAALESLAGELTQSELARKHDISQGAISRALGDIRRHARKLAQEFDEFSE